MSQANAGCNESQPGDPHRLRQTASQLRGVCSNGSLLRPLACLKTVEDQARYSPRGASIPSVSGRAASGKPGSPNTGRERKPSARKTEVYEEAPPRDEKGRAKCPALLSNEQGENFGAGNGTRTRDPLLGKNDTCVHSRVKVGRNHISVVAVNLEVGVRSLGVCPAE
jgi:hypothetical protein